MTKELSDAEFADRVEALLATEKKQPVGTWGLNFIDKGRSLGAVIVNARGMVHAMSECNKLHLNQGGQVETTEFCERCSRGIPAEMHNRLLSGAEYETLVDTLVCD